MILRAYQNYFFFEDKKTWTWILFFFLLVFSKLVIINIENINFFILFLHLNTFFSLPLIFLFNQSWVLLLKYFLFQRLGSLLIEFGYMLNYSFSDYIIVVGLLLKLGLLPFFWWFPNFLRNNNWFKIFIFKTFQKFPILYFIGFYFHRRVILLNTILYFALFYMGLFLILNRNNNLKYLIGWRSLIDSAFFCWVARINKKLFIYLFLLYIFVYILISFCFFFRWKEIPQELNKNQLLNSSLFFFGSFLILLLAGFPPFFLF